METILTIILIITSLTLIVVILLQSGEGSGLAAGFGGASAGTQVFGGSGAGGFLLKVTVVLGAVFMITSMALAYIASHPTSALAGIATPESAQGVGIQEDEIIPVPQTGVAPSTDEPAPEPSDAPAPIEDPQAAEKPE